MTFIVLVERWDYRATAAAEQLVEEGQWYDLGKGWRARADRPHTTGMQPHAHVYLRKNELFVVNRDGTPSHGSDLSSMPRRIQQRLRSKTLIEGQVTETASASPSQLVPKAVLAEAIKRADFANMIARTMRILSAR